MAILANEIYRAKFNNRRKDSEIAVDFNKCTASLTSIDTSVEKTLAIHFSTYVMDICFIVRKLSDNRQCNEPVAIVFDLTIYDFDGRRCHCCRRRRRWRRTLVVAVRWQRSAMLAGVRFKARQPRERATEVPALVNKIQLLVGRNWRPDVRHHRQRRRRYFAAAASAAAAAARPASVMDAHVSAHVGIPVERTVADRARVRLHARVNDLVFLQPYGAVERLAAHRTRERPFRQMDAAMQLQVEHDLERLAARLTHVRTLAGVHSRVPLERVLLTELAAALHAFVAHFARVTSHVCLQVGDARERLRTVGARERPGSLPVH